MKELSRNGTRQPAIRKYGILVLLLMCVEWTHAQVMASSNPALEGQSVIFTVEIDAPSGVTATPTGTVTFTDNDENIGTAPLQDGIALFTTQFSGTGDHVIVAEYSGDANFTPSSSPPFTEHVTADDVFTLSVSPSLIAQQSGGSSTLNLTVFGSGNSGGPVHFSCENLPPGTACSFQPDSVVPSLQGTAATATITSTIESLSGSVRRLSDATCLCATTPLAVAPMRFCIVLGAVRHWRLRRQVARSPGRDARRLLHDSCNSHGRDQHPTSGSEADDQLAEGEGKEGIMTSKHLVLVACLLAGILVNRDLTQNYAPVVNYVTGKAPAGLVAGDFNHDGNIDVIVANSGESTLSLFRGNGDGTFKPAITISIGSDPVSVAAADFNSDGNLDLAVSLAGSAAVQLLFGNGDGTFQAPVPVPVPTPGNTLPGQIVAADLNGDGHSDLLVATSSGLYVFLNDGHGRFSTSASLVGAAFNIDSFVVADFNQNGHPDIAWIGIGSSPCKAASAFLSYGNGDGTFQDPRALPMTNFMTGTIAAGDVNRDGRMDLVVSEEATNVCPPGTFSSLMEGSSSTAISLTSCIPAQSFWATSTAMANSTSLFSSPLSIHWLSRLRPMPY